MGLKTLITKGLSRVSYSHMNWKVDRYFRWLDDSLNPTGRYWRKQLRLCHMTGHLWMMTSYSSRTHLATLQCARCNPDGVGHPEGIVQTTYSGV